MGYDSAKYINYFIVNACGEKYKTRVIYTKNIQFDKPLTETTSMTCFFYLHAGVHLIFNSFPARIIT